MKLIHFSLVLIVLAVKCNSTWSSEIGLKERIKSLCCEKGTQNHQNDCRSHSPMPRIDELFNNLCKDSYRECCEQKSCERGKEEAFSYYGCYELPRENTHLNKCCEKCQSGIELGHSVYDPEACHSGAEDDPLERIRLDCCLKIVHISTDPDPLCDTGHEFDRRTGKCVDIDECKRGLHNCKENGKCINYEGSFKCEEKCDPGFALDVDSLDSKCVDINECESGTHNCSKSHVCHNTEGSYECRCQEGFEEDPNDKHCVDIDECKSDPSPCHSLADTWFHFFTVCHNTIGSYKCRCPFLSPRIKENVRAGPHIRDTIQSQG